MSKLIKVIPLFHLFLLFSLSSYGQTPSDTKAKIEVDNHTLEQDFETSEKLVEILTEMIEVSYYTSKGKTAELMSFISDNGLIKINDQLPMRYVPYRSDLDLDYVILLNKDEIEFPLMHESEMPLAWSSPKEIMFALTALMGWPHEMFKEIKARIMVNQNNPDLNFKVQYYDDQLIKVVSTLNGEIITHKKSNLVSLEGFQTINDELGNTKAYEMQFFYIDDDSKSRFLFDYRALYDEKSNFYYQSISAPLKQSNLRDGLNINSISIR